MKIIKVEVGEEIWIVNTVDKELILASLKYFDRKLEGDLLEQDSEADSATQGEG